MSVLAPDPAVPRRDALLRPVTAAGVLSRRLLGGVPPGRCELVYAKYRFGGGLRRRLPARRRDRVRAHVRRPRP